MTEVFQGIISWYMDNMNYFTITLLMAIESTFIPMPSELVVPPAAWKAANGELNIYLVVFFATLGALIGSLFNYFLAKSLGRFLIYKFADTRFAHMCLVTPEKVEKAEAYFIKNGNSSTFIGRLIPGVRHLISIPAGLANMKMGPFVLFTVLGAGIWNIILAVFGYVFYSQKELLERYFKELSIGLLILGALFILYLVLQGVRKRNSSN